MFLKKINLVQFKNHEEFSAEFINECNCITGENGSGKTSILDAIHFLSLTKSAITSQDANCVQHEQDYFMIKGIFEKLKSKYEVVCSYKNNERKQILIDKKQVEKLSEHIGQYPLVLLSPNDTDLVREGSETRRKYIDSLISQIDSEYLKVLIQYNKHLLQRNALLKQFAERNYFDPALMETFSEPLLAKSLIINRLRKHYLGMFLPIFIDKYYILSENREQVSIVYDSEVSEANFNDLFKNNYKNDLAAVRSTKGIHKDDFEFEINGRALKKYGSQGQQKSFVMALKLAQFEMIKNIKGYAPLLLMDDIFDKLDERRISMLVDMVKNKSFGQVFITDASPVRSHSLLEALGKKVKFIETKP